MRKIKILAIFLILLSLFTACSREKVTSFPDLNTVLNENIGKTEKEVKSNIGTLGTKEKSYLKHHFGDISFPILLSDYPDDAVSYRFDNIKAKVYSYEYAPRLLFVSKSFSDKEKILSSVSYSFDSKDFSEIYSSVLDFHENFINDFESSTYNEEFSDALRSIDEFENYFDSIAVERHTYTKDSIGVGISTSMKKGESGTIDDEREVAVLNYYTDDSFTNQISLSVHYIKETESYRFNIVYQRETLLLKYNTRENVQLYYKIGKIGETGTHYFGKEIFALDF